MRWMGALGWDPGPRGRPWPARLKEPSTCRAVPRPLLFGAPEEPQPLALNGQTVQKPEGWGAAPAGPPWLVKGPRPDAAKPPGAPPGGPRPSRTPWPSCGPPLCAHRAGLRGRRFGLARRRLSRRGRCPSGRLPHGAQQSDGGRGPAALSPCRRPAARGEAALGRGGAARGGLAGAPGFGPRAGKREATKGKCQGTKFAAGEGLVSPRGAFSCGSSLRESQRRSP